VLFDTSDPNNCNGLPNRFFECWSNGLPVITTAGTQVARIVLEEKGGIVIPDNSPQSIADAMSRFIDDPSLIEKMGHNARKAVEEKYSWGVAFRNINQLYTEVLKN
jgi:glycosyltransferase involved in cell wall biosynthesis